MKTFEIWSEGFAVTGNSAIAGFEGNYEGEDFVSACKAMVLAKGWDNRLYSAESNSFWGCRFFDNEADARKSFG